MHSTHNEYKSVVAERFIKILRVKISEKSQLMIINPNLILFK